MGENEHDYYSEDEPEQCVKYEDEACWGCGECDKDQFMKGHC